MKGIFLTLISLLTLLSVSGQEKSLIALIKSLEKEHQTVFSYNESLLSDIKIPGPYSGNNLTEILENLSNKSAFEFEIIDKENVLVKAKKEEKNLRLCLNITDRTTGETLIGANIYNPASSKGFMIGNDFQEKFINLKEWDTVMVRFVGFDSKSFPISYFNGKDCVSISLKEGEIKLSEITVKAYLNEGIQYRHSDQSISVSMKEAGLLPGETETDILTAIEALPGIKSPDGKAGNLLVRGDDPDKTLLTFDNIPIYHNGHYFGAFSPFNANITETVKIYRSGYGVENGGRVGGAIELYSKSDIADSATYGLGASTSYLSGYASMPDTINKFSILVGGRTSYPFKWNSPKINAISDFVFQNSVITAAEDLNFVEMTAFDIHFSDVNAKLIYELNDKNKIGVSFLNIYNNFHLNVLDTLANTENTTNAKLKNWGTNVNHQMKWNKRVTTNNSFTISDFSQEFSGILKNDTVTRETNIYENTVKDFNFKTSTTINFNSLDQLKFGYSLTHHDVYSFREIERSVEPLLDVDVNKAFLHALFMSYSLIHKDKFQATLGVRGIQYSKLNKYYAEPRLLVNYHIHKNFTLKSNIGMYNQFVNHLYGTNAIGPGIETYNWRLSNDSNTPVVNAKQAMAGIIFNRNGWVIDIEGYSKLTENISIHNQYDYLNTEDHYQGNYSTTGMDIMVKKSWSYFDVWMGYTYANTLVQYDSIQEDEFESIWNQNHVFNTVASYKIKRFNISAGWKYRTGLATLEGIRFLYTNGPSTSPTKPSPPPPPPGAPAPPPEPEDTFTINSDPDYGTQFPSNHQLDISVSYLYIPKSKNWNCNIGASVMNVYDNKTIIGQVVRRVKDGPQNLYTRTNLYGIGFAPSLMVMINF